MRKNFTGRPGLRGFSIAEMLVSATLILMVVAATYGLYLLAKDAWTVAYVQGHMQREAMLGLEKMVYGFDQSRNGIQGAVSYTIPGGEPSHITFVGTDGVSREFYQSADKVLYGIPGSTQDLIDADVSALTFTAVQDDLINITLELQRVVGGKAITADFNTRAQLRNR